MKTYYLSHTQYPPLLILFILFNHSCKQKSIHRKKEPHTSAVPFCITYVNQFYDHFLMLATISIIFSFSATIR